MLQFTDTHTHQYYSPEDFVQRTAAVERAFSAGVNRLLLPNVDVESMGQVLDLVHQYPKNCFPMLGLHPCSVSANFSADLETIKSYYGKYRFYGVGEIGLDFYWDKTFASEQKEAFQEQICWAKDWNLPIAVHCRNAFDEVLEVLTQEQNGQLKGVLHCFSGTLEQAQQIINLGFYLGIGGVVTYKNAGLDKVVASMPLEHLLLETDAPYLTPVPHRGKPNESSFLVHIAQKIADLHRCTVQEVADVTNKNATNLFNL